MPISVQDRTSNDALRRRLLLRLRVRPRAYRPGLPSTLWCTFWVSKSCFKVQPGVVSCLRCVARQTWRQTYCVHCLRTRPQSRLTNLDAKTTQAERDSCCSAGLTPAGVLHSWFLGTSIFSAFGPAGYLLVCLYFILGSAVGSSLLSQLA